ncbi:hypothetical protein DRQ18_02025 [bacterium]|nr:MAG: hypothetical protein DRQ18_02025 [bacterium]
MFKKFIEFWKTSDLLSVAYGDTEKMLRIARDMFEYSMRVMIEKEKEKEDIYKKDRELNELQVGVRRKVLEHLALNPAQDITPALTLITIVKDIERIGDYSKNVIELAHRYPDPLKGGYIEEIKAMERKVQENFQKAIKSFIDGDRDKGREVMESHAVIARECEEMIDKIMEDETLSAKLAVIYVLLIRYLKRVSAHVKNVASSVVNPFPKVDYKPEEE